MRGVSHASADVARDAGGGDARRRIAASARAQASSARGHRSDRRVLRRLGRPRIEAVDQQPRLGDAQDQLPVQRVLSRRLAVEDDDGPERRHPVARQRQPQRLQAGPARGHRSLLDHAEVPRREVVRAAQQHAGSVAAARVAQHAVLPAHGAARVARSVRAPLRQQRVRRPLHDRRVGGQVVPHATVWRGRGISLRLRLPRGRGAVLLRRPRDASRRPTFRCRSSPRRTRTTLVPKSSPTW